MTSALERRRTLEERLRKKGGRENRRRMRVESGMAGCAHGNRGLRTLRSGSDDPLAQKPRDRDALAGGVDDTD
jgi:hypothetical protein